MTEMYGPNTALVERVIEQARNLTAEQVEQLYDTWDPVHSAAWYAAWDAAHYPARESAWYAARESAWYAARDAAWRAAKDSARAAMRDAAIACVVADLITAEQFATLTAPWVKVMGPLEVTT